MPELEGKKLSVVVPAYNKALGLYDFLTSLTFELEKITPNYEVVVVDDGSQDATRLEAIRYKKENGYPGQKVFVFDYPMNVGKGFALSFGFSKTTGDVIVFMDADLDLPPRQLQYYLKTFIKKNADIVIGSKRHPMAKVQYPLRRRMYSLVFQWMIRILFHLTVADTQVGMKVFRRDVLEQVIPRIVVKAFAFDLELLVVAHHLGYKRIIEVPADLRYKHFGSTISPIAIKNMIQDTLAIFYRKHILKYYMRPLTNGRLSESQILAPIEPN